MEKYFAVVGVLENMDQSLEVLENYVPRYFRNARKVYKDLMWGTHVNKNKQKPPTPNYIKQMMLPSFRLEIEFYEFCKQRLTKQYLAIL